MHWCLYNSHFCRVWRCSSPPGCPSPSSSLPVVLPPRPQRECTSGSFLSLSALPGKHPASPEAARRRRIKHTHACKLGVYKSSDYQGSSKWKNGTHQHSVSPNWRSTLLWRNGRMCGKCNTQPQIQEHGGKSDGKTWTISSSLLNWKVNEHAPNIHVGVHVEKEKQIIHTFSGDVRNLGNLTDSVPVKDR